MMSRKSGGLLDAFFELSWGGGDEDSGPSWQSVQM